jgi:hypothetical protein
VAGGAIVLAQIAKFFVIKLLTTGMGKTTSDYLAHPRNPIFAVALSGGELAIVLLLQFSVGGSHPATLASAGNLRYLLKRHVAFVGRLSNCTEKESR